MTKPLHLQHRDRRSEVKVKGTTQLREQSALRHALKEARRRQLQAQKWPPRAIAASCQAKQGRHGWGGQ